MAQERALGLLRCRVAWLMLIWPFLVASQIRALSGAELRKAAVRAINSVRLEERRPDPAVALLLLHIDKRFRVGRPIPWSIEQIQQLTPRHAQALLRMAFPEFVASESDVKGMKGLDRILGSALYCDLYTLPWDFYSSIESAVRQTATTAVYSLRAIAMLKEKRCSFDDQRISNLAKSLVPAVQRIAGSPGALSNIRLEAMIALLQSGGPSLVKPEWIAEVYLLQRNDGSLHGRPLSSLLAAWLFLEYHAQAAK